MPLRANRFLPFYNSKENDIIEEFYVPALSNCTEYKRVSAYFDSNILSLYATGIEHIVQNKGHISFIFSSEISEEDFELMKDGYKNREALEKQLVIEADTDAPSIELSNLAYLIEKGFVDIKIAFVKRGIAHDKFGLICDDDDVLYFRGSNNETVAAAKNNLESFETSASWNCDENELLKIKKAQNLFEMLWEDNYPETVVIEIPDIVKDKIVSYSKDKLILDYENKENTFVFDLDSDNNLIGKNNLENPQVLLPSAIWYRGYLQYYVINDPTLDLKYKFRKDISYVIMRKIINLVSDRGIDKGFEIYLSPRLRKFLWLKDIQADKRKSLGCAIKSKDPCVLDAFNEFKEIVDDALARPLREPQMWDAFHIAKMKRSANFSVPGAGKTSIVYGAFAYLLKTHEVNKIVMIGPINSFMAWKNEFVLNFGSKLKLTVYDYQSISYKNPQERYDGISNDTKNANLVLFNYESINKNVDAIKRVIDDKTLLVFDEVHRIKSTDGVRALACLNVAVKAMYKVVLTGTPIPNGFVDIYNFLHILFPDEYDMIFNFDKSFLDAANRSDDKREKINTALYPFFCRTTKKDLMVPPPEDDDLTTGYCTFGEDYERLLKIIYRVCDYNTLLLYIRLLQASTNPKLILRSLTKDDLHSFDSEEDTFDFSSIFDVVIKKEEYTDEEVSFISKFGMTEKFYRGINLAERIVNSGEQVIIWEIFVDTIAQTRSELLKLGISCEVIYGGVSISEREDIIKRFINKEFSVLITNPHTLAESVSLHKNCHNAIYMEYSFNLVHMLQSRDRIHRLGLEPDEKTYYYYMMMDNQAAEYNTIDRKIYDRLKFKEELQSQAVEGDGLIYIEDDFKKDVEELLYGTRW